MKFPEMRAIARNLAIPKSFAGKIAVLGTCDLLESETELLSAALALVDKRLKTCPPPSTSFRLNILVFDTSTITIDFFSARRGMNYEFGYHFDAIFFPVGLWRDAKLSRESILFIMLEELSHLVWRITDESAVKKHVEVMLRFLNPKADAKAFLRRIALESLTYSSNLPAPSEDST